MSRKNNSWSEKSIFYHSDSFENGNICFKEIGTSIPYLNHFLQCSVLWWEKSVLMSDRIMFCGIKNFNFVSEFFFSFRFIIKELIYIFFLFLTVLKFSYLEIGKNLSRFNMITFSIFHHCLYISVKLFKNIEFLLKYMIFF